MPKVTFQPAGVRGEVDEGITIMEAADTLGVGIESLCGGKGRCGKCRVKVEKGKVTDVTKDEEEFLSPSDFDEGYRLACMARVRDDAEIYIPAETHKGGQVILAEGRGVAFEMDPLVEKFFVETGEGMIGAEGLVKALGELGCIIDKIDEHVEKTLASLSRSRGITATLRGNEVIRVEEDISEGLYGCAVDIGTTTVVAFLADMRTGRTLVVESMMNPQIRSGEDVMSRLANGMKHGDREMTDAIREGCNNLISSMTKQVGIEPVDIVETVVVGNTAMHHLFFGLDTSRLGVVPFVPAVKDSIDVKAREAGLTAAPGSYVHSLPNVAGFVGADNVAACLATEPFAEGTALLIDIGTNGEIVLGNVERMVGASCATGPAFEGGHIGAGMRAAEGAIESADVIDGRLVPSTIGGGPPMGICGSGLIDIVAGLRELRIMDDGGGLDPSAPGVRQREGGPEYVLVDGAASATGRDIVLTKKDISEVQLAKGALLGGCRILMGKMGIRPGDIERVVLAGAFGSKIRPESALAIGMLPPVKPSLIETVGNAAGEGARMALLCRQKRDRAREIAGKMEYIELTTDPDFEAEFVKALRFPS